MENTEPRQAISLMENTERCAIQLGNIFLSSALCRKDENFVCKCKGMGETTAQGIEMCFEDVRFATIRASGILAAEQYINTRTKKRGVSKLPGNPRIYCHGYYDLSEYVNRECYRFIVYFMSSHYVHYQEPRLKDFIGEGRMERYEEKCAEEEEMAKKRPLLVEVFGRYLCWMKQHKLIADNEAERKLISDNTVTIFQEFAIYLMAYAFVFTNGKRTFSEVNFLNLAFQIVQNGKCGDEETLWFKVKDTGIFWPPRKKLDMATLKLGHTIPGVDGCIYCKTGHCAKCKKTIFHRERRRKEEEKEQFKQRLGEGQYNLLCKLLGGLQ